MLGCTRESNCYGQSKKINLSFLRRKQLFLEGNPDPIHNAKATIDAVTGNID
jgi:hypothetical protein